MFTKNKKTVAILLLLILFIFHFNFNFKYEHFYETNDMKKNCFFVISKEVTSNMYNEYTKVFQGNLHFISDKPTNLDYNNIHYYSNDLMKSVGFKNAHNFIEITSWDKVFYYISKENLVNKYDYFWIIEDDCFIHQNRFLDYVNELNSDNSELLLFGWYKTKKYDNWYYWNKNKINNKSYFKEEHLCSAITQLVRLKPTLINKILNFRKKHNKFCFHELMFASIAKENNLKINVIKNDKIKLSAFKNYLSNKSSKELNNLNYIAIHPVKNWYD